jgi:hypothetical protein
MPKTNEVIFDEPYEQRKLLGSGEIFGGKDILSDGIFVLERRNFPATLFYGRYEDLGMASVAPVQASTSDNEGAPTVRLTTGNGRSSLLQS